MRFKGLNVLENRRCSIVVEDGTVKSIDSEDRVDDNLFICPGGLVDTQVTDTWATTTPRRLLKANMP